MAFVVFSVVVAALLLLSNGNAVDAGNCNVKADIILLVDGSKSVSNGGRSSTGDPSYYRDYIFKMIKEMISDFGVGDNDNIHMGAIFFGKENIADTISEGWAFGLDDFPDKDKMMQFLDGKRGVPFFDSSYTAVALNKADKLFESSKRSFDRNVARALVLITDGEPTDTADADALIQREKDNHATVVTLGIGSGIDEDMLKKWASKERYYVKVEFDNVDVISNTLESVLCNAIKESSPRSIVLGGDAKHMSNSLFDEDNGNTRQGDMSDVPALRKDMSDGISKKDEGIPSHPPKKIEV